MDTPSFFSALFSMQSPLLPGALAFRLYLDVAWGLVLAALTLALWPKPRQAWRLHWWLPPVMVLWCLLPGEFSPAYWLGLALRAPSGLLVLLCAWSLWCQFQPQMRAQPRQALRAWAWPLVVLGWLLLLDTFALLPFSLYAWGFAPVVLGGLAVLGLLPLLAGAPLAMSSLWIAALLLHVLLRVPTGNAWDAVLDPMLWAWLQVVALRRLRRRA